MKPVFRKWLLRGIGLVLLFALIWWVFRKVPLLEIWNTIRQLHAWQILVILLVNTFIFTCVTLRWWIIVQTEAKHVNFLPLLAVRVSVYGVSYFTLGPQVGGEPLQVFYLQRKYAISYVRAVATVILDKLLEFLIDFLLLAIGITALLQAGLLREGSVQRTISWVGMALLVLIPPAYLFFLSRRRTPATALLHRLPFLHRNAKVIRFVQAAEWLAGTFVRRHPRDLVKAIGVSLFQAVGMLLDYSFILSFLGIHLPFWKDLAGWTAGWLSFLVPLPGGLGAMEASQVFALGTFGISAGVALSVALVMRGRDVFIGGLGLLMAGRGWSRRKPTSPVVDHKTEVTESDIHKQ